MHDYACDRHYLVLPYGTQVYRAKVTIFLKGDEYFARQNFTQQDNYYLSKCLVTLLGSLALQLKTLLLLLGEIFRRAKVTNFSFGDENFVRRIILPNMEHGATVNVWVYKLLML